MGIGDKLMAIGDAWAQFRADPSGRRVAIGDGSAVDATDAPLSYGLSGVLADQSAIDAGEPVSWIISHPGHRPYIDYDAMRLKAAGFWPERAERTGSLLRRLGHYIWRDDYKAKPATLVLTEGEFATLDQWRARGPYVVMEPHTKPGAPTSKLWPFERFDEVARVLRRNGLPVIQVGAADGRPILPGAAAAQTERFRDVLPILKAATLYIGPEGALHHAAAAVGTPAVVMFGGFVPPSVTGYEEHVNLTGGATSFCGTRRGLCPHCLDAMSAITAGEVVRHALRIASA